MSRKSFAIIDVEMQTVINCGLLHPVLLPPGEYVAATIDGTPVPPTLTIAQALSSQQMRVWASGDDRVGFRVVRCGTLVKHPSVAPDEVSDLDLTDEMGDTTSAP